MSLTETNTAVTKNWVALPECMTTITETATSVMKTTTALADTSEFLETDAAFSGLFSHLMIFSVSIVSRRDFLFDSEIRSEYPCSRH